MHRAIPVFVMLIAAWPACAQKPAGNVENGKRLFTAVGCYQCHGRAAQGGAAGPRLGPKVIALPAFVIYVRHPAGAMPPYTTKVISDAELTDIHAYIKTMPPPAKVEDTPLLKP
jgi:ubiquinol-cytochrome c reductase cytochrome c subunit